MAVYFDVTQCSWFPVCQFVNIKIAYILLLICFDIIKLLYRCTVFKVIRIVLNQAAL
jgi:hypothetical protein